MATRKRLRLETPHRDGSEAPTISALSETLQAVIDEVRQLRVEQARREEEYTATIRRQEEELRRLRGTNPVNAPQLSPSIVRASGDTGSRNVNVGGTRVTRGEGASASDAGGSVVRPIDGIAVADGASEGSAHPAGRSAVPDDASVISARPFVRNTTATAVGSFVGNSRAGSTFVTNDANRTAGDAAIGTGVGLGYKLKPDTYDGTVPLQEYLFQFNLIARANFWDDATKTVALASSLRGKARTVLETVQDIECLNFSELKSKLELRFGEGRLTQNYYSALTNRRQRFGEDLAALGSDIERLSRLAYPECPHEIREKIACSQFVTAVSDHFIRRTLQLEGITSLYQAVERTKALRIIQGEGFTREKFVGNSAKEGQEGGANNEEEDEFVICA